MINKSKEIKQQQNHSIAFIELQSKHSILTVIGGNQIFIEDLIHLDITNRKDVILKSTTNNLIEVSNILDERMDDSFTVYDLNNNGSR